jgi:hypothetical protein
MILQLLHHQAALLQAASAQCRLASHNSSNGSPHHAGVLDSLEKRLGDTIL